MNDTVGTQVATAFDHGECDMAVVIGKIETRKKNQKIMNFFGFSLATGTNASYVEKFEKIRNIEDTPYPYEQVENFKSDDVSTKSYV